jgi:hypothetical protein
MSCLHFLWCTTKRLLQGFFMASSSLYMPTKVSPLGELYHSPLETPSCAMWFRGVTPNFTTHLAPDDSRVSHLPHTTIWHVQTDLYHLLGQVVSILGSRCHMSILGDRFQELILNMIQVTYQTRGLPINPQA